MRDVDRSSALRAARVSRGKYCCAACEGIFGRTQVQVDHIVAIGSFRTWDAWISRLFCGAANLQVLCLDCHKTKTAKERK